MSCTVSGNIKSILGVNAVGNGRFFGSISFALVNFGTAVPQIYGTNLIAPRTACCNLASDGSFSITLDGNDSITPSNTLYSVYFTDANGIQYGPYLFSITGSTFNLNTAVAVGTPSQPVFTNQPVLLNPTASQTISQPASTFLTVSGTTPFQVHTGAADQNLWVDSGSNAGGPSGAGTSLRSVNDAFNLVEPLTLQGNPILLNPANSGNVGVGTTSPAFALDVNGTTRSTYYEAGPMNLLAGNNVQVGIYSDTVDQIVLECYEQGDSAVKYNIVLAKYGGNVGIGTASPAYPLDVNGIINASGTIQSGGDLLLSRTTSTGFVTRRDVSGQKNLEFSCAGGSPLDSVAANTTVFNVTGTYQQNGTNGVTAGPFTSVSSITASGGIVTALSGSVRYV